MMAVSWQATAGKQTQGQLQGPPGLTCLGHLAALDGGVQQLQLAGLRREGAACQQAVGAQRHVIRPAAWDTWDRSAASCELLRGALRGLVGPRQPAPHLVPHPPVVLQLGVEHVPAVRGDQGVLLALQHRHHLL